MQARLNSKIKWARPIHKTLGFVIVQPQCIHYFSPALVEGTSFTMVGGTRNTDFGQSVPRSKGQPRRGKPRKSEVCGRVYANPRSTVKEDSDEFEEPERLASETKRPRGRPRKNDTELSKLDQLSLDSDSDLPKRVTRSKKSRKKDGSKDFEILEDQPVKSIESDESDHEPEWDCRCHNCQFSKVYWDYHDDFLKAPYFVYCLCSGCPGSLTDEKGIIYPWDQVGQEEDKWTKEEKEQIIAEYAQKMAQNTQEKKTKQPAATDWAGQNNRHFWYHTGKWDVSDCHFILSITLQHCVPQVGEGIRDRR